MRLKHILLPTFAIMLFSAYAVYSEMQQSKFDSGRWAAATFNDIDETRANTLSPLMAHVLKVGMSIQEVDTLLGLPNEERSGGNYKWLGGYDYMRRYIIEKENSVDLELVVEFEIAMDYSIKVTNFYISGAAMPLLF